MAFARGKYGVEYNPIGRSDESHPFRWIFAAAAILAAVSFLFARGCRKTAPPIIEDKPKQISQPAPRSTPLDRTKPEANVAPVKPVRTSATTPSTDQQKPSSPAKTTAPDNSITSAVHTVRGTSSASADALIAATNWLETARTRPNAEAALLARLADAERLGNKRIARDTLEKLRRSSAMADLDDPFARRLGVLNAEILFSPPAGVRDGWTVPVVVKRGDNAQRIAREHGTTLAAVLKLNSLKDANRIRTGDTLRILEFPRATLVVHAGLRFADISLNGRFFKRYDLTLPKKPSNGSYPVTRDEGPMDRFNSLGLKFSTSDRDELALLLAPGSRIIVSPL